MGYKDSDSYVRTRAPWDLLWTKRNLISTESAHAGAHGKQGDQNVDLDRLDSWQVFGCKKLPEVSTVISFCLSSMIDIRTNKPEETQKDLHRKVLIPR